MKNILIFIALTAILGAESFAGAGSFPQGDSVKLLRDKIKFKSNRTIDSNTVDPTSVATPGDQGSILTNDTGIYWKADAGTTTNWVILNSPLTTLGDILVRGAAGNERLPIGTQDYVLTSELGVPVWKEIPTQITVTTKGDLQSHDGTSPASLGVGSDGSFLVADSNEIMGIKWSDQLQGVLNPVRDWKDAITCTGSWTTNTTYSCKYKQIGDEVIVQYLVSATGTPNSTSLGLDLPDGLQVDESKLQIGDVQYWIGQGQATDFGSSRYHVMGRYSSSASRIIVSLYRNSIANYDDVASVSITTPFNFGNNDFVNLTIRLPVQGWTSGTNAVVRNETMLKVKAKRTTNQTFASSTNTIVLYNVESEDNYNAWDSSTGVFTSPKNADYLVCAGLQSASVSWGANQYWQLQTSLSVSTQDEYLDREKADSNSTDLYAQGCNVYKMSQGETMSILLRHIRGSNTNIGTNGDFNYITITEKPNSNVITGTFGKCQTKYLSADITTNTTDVTDLRFNNLEVGGRFKAITSPRFNISNSDNIVFDLTDNAGYTCRVNGTANPTGVPMNHNYCRPFNSGSNTLQVNVSAMNAGNSVLGNGSQGETHVTLCTDNTEDTTEWN